MLFFHLYECQEIQIKNPFDKVLSLSFNLGPLKVNTMCQKESIFQMTIKRTHTIKNNGWEKHKENKNPLATLKKHSYPRICGILTQQHIIVFERIKETIIVLFNYKYIYLFT